MIDLHTHTDRSDGSVSPSQLVLDAKAMGLEALGITDHDTLDGYDIAAPLAAEQMREPRWRHVLWRARIAPSRPRRTMIG